MKNPVFLATAFLITAVISCGSDIAPGNAKIHININLNEGRSGVSKAIQGSHFPENVNRIRIAIYAGQVADSRKIFDKTFGRDTQEALVEVQSGPARILVIEGQSIFGFVLYRGISDPVDLADGETATIPVRMEEIPFETAGVTINLKNIDGTADFDLASHADLLNNEVKISAFTASNAAFNQEDIENIKITCDMEGDYSINDSGDMVPDNSFPISIIVPANTFLVIAVRGNSISHSGDLTVLGAVFITGSALAPDSTGKEININMLDCSLFPLEQDVDPVNSWNDYCDCR